MNIQEYDILNAIFTTTNATQRSLADCSGHSLGIVNRSIKKLTSDGYLTSSMQPTDKAIALYKHSVPAECHYTCCWFWNENGSDQHGDTKRTAGDTR